MNSVITERIRVFFDISIIYIIDVEVLLIYKY